MKALGVLSSRRSMSLLTLFLYLSAFAAVVASTEPSSRPVSSQANNILHDDTTDNATSGNRAAGPWWMNQMKRMGTMPWGDDPNYKVFRNVLDYGAVGNGVTDDTDAIMAAMSDGGRCVSGMCYGSTTKNAVVYFPSGTYLVSRSIIVGMGTVMVGDAINWPTIHGSKDFVGLGVVSTNGQTPSGPMWIPPKNYFRQIRNFKINITDTPQDAYVCAIHHQAGPANSLQNLELIASSKWGTTQQGIFMEDGSGGLIADITFRGGNIGMYVGNQQVTSQRLKFDNLKIAVQLHWDWAWTFKSIEITNCLYGFVLHSNGFTSVVGALTLIDSRISNTYVGIMMDLPDNSTVLSSDMTSVAFDNVLFYAVKYPVQQSAVMSNGTAVTSIHGGSVLLHGETCGVDSWIVGNVYWDPMTRSRVLGWRSGFPRRVELVVDAPTSLPRRDYFERSKPQYEHLGPEHFVNLKDYAAGDGVTDDTVAVQRAIDENAATAADANGEGQKDGKVIFVDAGIYLISDTINVPAGTRMVGEAWPQFMAYGANFSDAAAPRPLFRVGEFWERGIIELQDLLFTTRGPTVGLIGIEWNIIDEGKGTAGMWDCHVRIGGARGTNLTSVECPPSPDGSIHGACRAGTLMMHITSNSSGYFENMWLWTADHEIDDSRLHDPLVTTGQSSSTGPAKLSVYTARGLLVESQVAQGLWLYATAVEHAAVYQYNFFGATSVFAGLLHGETPYYQPLPRPPFPFSTVFAAAEQQASQSLGILNMANVTQGVDVPSTWRWRLDLPAGDTLGHHHGIDGSSNGRGGKRMLFSRDTVTDRNGNRLQNAGVKLAIISQFAGDPDYTMCGSATSETAPGCDAAWGLIIRQSFDVVIGGANLYSWFQAYDDSCTHIPQDVVENQFWNGPNCQQLLVWASDNPWGVRISNLVTVGASGMVWADGIVIPADINRVTGRKHPYWSAIALFNG